MKPLNRSTLINFLLHPVFILFIFNLIFFIKPLVLGLYLSPADALQRFPSFNLGEFHAPQNSLLFDPVTQFHPWYKYIKDSLLSGNLPLWNPYNAGGVPFLANTISAVFYPLSIIYYIFPFQLATILFPFSKLFLAGLFTYLFLRQLGIGKYPSLVGATAFNFSAFNITFLLWPQTNVIIFLPLLLYLTEKLLSKIGDLKNLFIFFSLSVTFSIFAGHPETTFHIFIVVILYFLFRLLGKEFNKKEKLENVKFIIKTFVYGILLSSILLIPFVEYLFHSYALSYRVGTASTGLLPLSTLIYNLFPNVSGSPATSFYRPLFGNYNEITGAYTGPIILLLTLISVILLKKKDRVFLFFILISLAVLPLIYKIPIFSPFSEITSNVIGNTRLLFVIAFSQSILAAFVLEHISELKRLMKKSNILVSIMVVLTIFALLIIGIVIKKFIPDLNPDKIKAFIAYEKEQILFFALTLISGIYLIKKYTSNQQNYYLIFLAIVVFLQTGILNIKYNPVIEEKYFYPDTADISYLKRLPQGKYIELGGNHIIPADINLYYGLNSVHNYDAIDIREYKELFNRDFSNKTTWDTVLYADNESLNKFGIKYILTDTDINKKIVFDQNTAVSYHPDFFTNVTFEQIFTATDDKLYAVRLLPANFNRSNQCHLIFELRENKNNKRLFVKEFPCSALSDKIFYQINLPEILGSKGKEYKMIISIPDGKTGDAISFWHDDNKKMVFHTLYNQEVNTNLKKIYQGKFKIFENVAAPNEYYISYSKNEKDKIRIVNSTPTYKKIELNLESDTLIKSTNAYYPGWKAYIDSGKGKMENVDNAFQGIIVPRGKHILEVIYQPTSFFLGALMSICGLIFLGLISIKSIKTIK